LINFYVYIFFLMKLIEITDVMKIEYFLNTMEDIKKKEVKQYMLINFFLSRNYNRV